MTGNPSVTTRETTRNGHPNDWEDQYRYVLVLYPERPPCNCARLHGLNGALQYGTKTFEDLSAFDACIA